MKSVYLCTRKTTGTRGWKEESLLSAVLWENDPSKVWKVSVKNLINSKDKSESRQKKVKKEIQFTKKSLILAQDER